MGCRVLPQARSCTAPCVGLSAYRASIPLSLARARVLSPLTPSLFSGPDCAPRHQRRSAARRGGGRGYRRCRPCTCRGLALQGCAARQPALVLPCSLLVALSSCPLQASLLALALGAVACLLLVCVGLPAPERYPFGSTKVGVCGCGWVWVGGRVRVCALSSLCLCSLSCACACILQDSTPTVPTSL